MWDKKDTFKERFTKERISQAVGLLPWGYRQISWRYKVTIWLNVVLGIIPPAIGIYTAYLGKQVIDAAVAGDRSLFWHYMIMIIAFSLFNLLYGIAYSYFTTCESSALNIYMRIRIYNQLIGKEYGSLENYRTGELLQRVQGDTSNIGSFFFNFPKDMAVLVLNVAGCAALIIATAPVLAWLAIPVTFIMALVTYLIKSRLKEKIKEKMLQSGTVSSVLIEHLKSIIIFRTFRKESFSRKTISREMHTERDLQLALTRKNLLYGNISSLLMLCITMGSTIYFALRIMDESITFGTYTMMLGLVGRLQGQIGSIADIIPRMYNLMIATERVTEITRLPDDLKKSPVEKERALQYYKEELISLGLKDVTFAYPRTASRKILDHMDLEIQKGEFLAITGHSGCGKSTLLKLLLCLYQQQEGSLYLKGLNGETPLDSSWRSLFCYVSQQTHLLSGTVRDAIAFTEDASGSDLPENDEKYWHVLRIACADGFVREMENGLDTQIGELGTGLSEGQAQRLAIARAVFTGQPILLLDECTSALDAETEQKVLENIRNLTDRTVICVTHRPKALEYCDRRILFP